MKSLLLAVKGAKTLDAAAKKNVLGGKVPPGGCPNNSYWHPNKRCCWDDSKGRCVG